MKRLLVIVDMQNDFITGALANTEGQKIVTRIADYARNFDGDIVATRDTHQNDYMNTQEGKKLPVPHCIEGTNGWNIVPEIQTVLDTRKDVEYVNKPTFGSTRLGAIVDIQNYDEIELCGVCTDICVISNAMLIKAFNLKAEVTVLKDLCAGVTPESHETALKAMTACQITVA